MAFLNRMQLRYAVVFGVFAALCGVWVLWQLSVAISGLFEGSLTLHAFGGVLVWVVPFVILRALFGALQSHFAMAMAKNAKTKLRLHIMESMQQHISTTPVGLQITHWVKGVESLDAWFGQFVPQVFLTMIIPTILLVISFSIDWLTGLVFLISAPLLPLFLALIGMTAKKKTQEQWKLLAQQGNLYLETLQGLKTLKLFGRSQDWGLQIMESARVLRDATLTVLRLAFLSAFVLEMVGTIGTAIIAVEIGLRLLYGQMEYQPALFLLMLAPEFYLPLRTLGLRAHAAMEGGAAAEVLFKEYPVTNSGLTNKIEVARSANLPGLIECENIFVQWAPSAPMILSDVSWTFPMQGKIGVAGASGAGKSTLIALLTGRLKATQGLLQIHENVNMYYVPQAAQVFQRTLRDNLHLTPNAANEFDEVLWGALKRVALYEFVEQLPQKLDTLAGENGARLSGGQQRRLVLARAFVQLALGNKNQHSLLILDEPEAHLDEASVLAIEKSIFDGPESALIVSHRPDTLNQCDSVLYLKNGRVVDFAPHETLLKNPEYALLMLGGAQ